MALYLYSLTLVLIILHLCAPWWWNCATLSLLVSSSCTILRCDRLWQFLTAISLPVLGWNSESMRMSMIPHHTTICKLSVCCWFIRILSELQTRKGSDIYRIAGLYNLYGAKSKHTKMNRLVIFVSENKDDYVEKSILLPLRYSNISVCC